MKAPLALVAVLAVAVIAARADAVRLHVTLSVDKVGTGSGYVGSSPPFIDCGSVCYASIPAEETGGTPIVLKARPDPGSVFTGWAGACEGPSSDCTLEVQDSVSVTAIFDRAGSQTTFPLAVGKTGSGIVTSSPGGIQCGSACSAPFVAGATIALTAVPAEAWSFSGWTGACSGTAGCSVVMDGPRTATANFTQIPAPTPPPPPPPGSPPPPPAPPPPPDPPPPQQTFPLAVGKTGTGTVTSSPAGINCGSSCSAFFESGTAVILTASPARGSVLAGWSGACAARGRTCMLRMDEAKAAVALFSDNRDTVAPTVRALPSSAKRGKTARLRYRVSDDSGKSREDVTVSRGRRVLARIRGRLDAAEVDVLYYYASWKVPRSVGRGTLRFCVRAVDAAGNRSKPSCSSLRVT